MTLRQDRFPVDSRSPDWQPDANSAQAPDDPRDDGPGVQRHPIAAHIVGLALLAVLTPLHGLWAAQVVLVPLLLTFPGVLLLRVLRVPGKAVAACPIYLPSAALVVLTATGLAVDLIGPLLHISEPLRAAPLLVGLEIVCAALLACSVSAPPQTRIPWSSLPRPLKLAWPLLLPLVSAAGALRLNSGHSGHLAAIAVVATIILLVIAFLMAPQFDRALLAIVLFATGLGMMWSFSLRGSSVYGFDIAGEYYWLNQTVVTGVWHFSHSTDAYGAMLSVTVLPAELHALSGMPALLIFKVVYPVIFAMFPVAVYTLGNRVLGQRWAFLAGALVIVQLAFFEEFPALAREEIATVLFAALISAVLDTALAQWTRLALVFLLGMTLAVSHYSTAYLAIALLAIAAVLQWATSWFRPIQRLSAALLLACGVCLVTSFVWYGPLTHSTSNLQQFVAQAKGQGLNLLPNRSGNLLATYLQGESTPELTPAQYQRYISQYYKTNDKFIIPLPDAGEPQYALRAASVPPPSITWPLGNSLLNLADLLITQLMNLMCGIGALMLALHRKAPILVRQVGLIGLGAMVILVLTRFSGTIAQLYNPERVFLQMTIVIAIAACWPLQRLAEKWKRTRSGVVAICAFSLAALLLGSSSLSGVAFGGGTKSNLANNFADYQAFVVTSPETAAASWVIKEAPTSQWIYADSFAQLRLNAVAKGRPSIRGDIVPQVLDQHAWVYADRTNVVDGIAQSNNGDHSATYAFPARFLDSNYELVYTNGTSEVYHR